MPSTDRICISCWRDLEQYGIGYLTGESCAYNLRVLCDLTPKGEEIMESFLGLSKQDAFPDSWNTQVAGEPAKSSVMLSRGVFKELAIFCLFYSSHCRHVLYREADGAIHGVLDAEDLEEIKRLYGCEFESTFNVFSNLHALPGLDRNEHMASGRSV